MKYEDEVLNRQVVMYLKQFPEMLDVLENISNRILSSFFGYIIGELKGYRTIGRRNFTDGTYTGVYKSLISKLAIG